MKDDFSAVLFGASFLVPADSPRARLLVSAAENSRVQKDRSLIRIVPFRSRYVAGGDGEGLRAAWRDTEEWLSDRVAVDAVENGFATLSRNDRTIFYSPENDVSVVVESSGRVVTVSYGKLRP